LKIRMAQNSVFAILLRSPWWISFVVAAVIALPAAALLPDEYRVVGVMAVLPFVVIGAIAARRQWRLPGKAELERVQQALAGMTWQQFAGLLEAAFQADGHTVRRGAGTPVDFELERNGRITVVCARRWKSARIGLDALGALQAARDGGDATDAIYVGLGELTDTAREFATRQRLTIWQAPELAQALRGRLPATKDGTRSRRRHRSM
jgi:restriction system protein